MEDLIRAGVENSLLMLLLIGMLPAFLIDLRAFLLWKKDDATTQFNGWTSAWRVALGAFSGALVWSTTQVGLVESRWLQGLLAGALSGIAVDLDAIRLMQSFQEAIAYDYRWTVRRAAQGAIVGLGAAYGVAFV